MEASTPSALLHAEKEIEIEREREERHDAFQNGITRSCVLIKLAFRENVKVDGGAGITSYSDSKKENGKATLQEKRFIIPAKQAITKQHSIAYSINSLYARIGKNKPISSPILMVMLASFITLFHRQFYKCLIPKSLEKHLMIRV